MLPAWLILSPLMVAFWLASAACVLPEIVHSFMQRSAPGDRRRDRGSHAVLVAGSAGGFILGFNLAAALPAATISHHGRAMLAVGVVVMLSGVALRWYSVAVLGRFFTRTVMIRADHEIVERGPYRYLRHPSYSGYLLEVLGCAIALDNFAAAVVLLGVNLVIYSIRMRVEEAALMEAFGPAYAAYRRRTSRIVPFIY